jgi:Right handed beta helix region
MKTCHFKKLVLSSTLIGLSQISFAACDQTLSAGANIATAVSSAASGTTICLNAGSYPGFSGSIKKTSLTTVTSAPGLSNSQVTLSSVDVGSSQYLAFVGMTIGGATISTSNAAAMHIQFKNNAFTRALNILTPGNANQDILIDGNTFINVGQGLTEGRLGVRGFNNNTINGVVISNNLFKGSGPSDGVQIIAGAYGTVIGPGNEFVGIKQSGCGSVHCDPIQFYGASRSTITGNYFHGNSTGLMLNGGDGQATITNNVFVTDGEYPDQIVRAGTSGDVITHNTFANGARMRFGDSLGTVTNATIKDNISSGLSLQYGQTQSALGSISYNLINGSAIGTGGISGTPTYNGGSTPTTWGGYVLASSSKGYKSASDGKDMGAYSFGTVTVVTSIAPPTNLIVK